MPQIYIFLSKPRLGPSLNIKVKNKTHYNKYGKLQYVPDSSVIYFKNCISFYSFVTMDFILPVILPHKYYFILSSLNIFVCDSTINTIAYLKQAIQGNFFCITMGLYLKA